MTTVQERSVAGSAPTLHTVPVSGEIRTIACREGSSGIFSGGISGLYQGYRFGSTVPEDRECVMEVPHGTLTFVLRQQIVTPLPPRPAEHPFRDGRDPFAEKSAGPPGAGGPPGPGGPGGHHGPPGAGGPPGTENGKPIFKKVHYMESMLRVDPERSTGIFSGATGEFEIEAPNYRMPGHLVVDTADGELRLNFLEKGSRDTLSADLWVDGDRSTGIYRGASGRLRFDLKVTPPFFGEGTYSGTLVLERDASADR
ncbi:hypothetical protein DY218_31045 [Streptomyces triticagri]|uniref:Uncharacterized protein n=1 Tax=Streptomyces triticagri TaxID=2293568 RepID=A0A372LVT1_9ACTN|nr:hypothetical protein [Streptomyces triticagri]RFU82786.1 hypothetical protein DY218_31045 [Streptomyces triticagri]